MTGLPPRTAARVQIRPARPPDAERIAAMVHGLAALTDPQARVEITAADLHRFGFGTDPVFHILVAELAGELCGYCLYSWLFSTWRGRPGLFVVDLYVEPGVRGRKVGRELLGAAAGVGARQGAAFIRLDIASSNDAAKRFYRRLGFRPNADPNWLVDGAHFDALAGQAPADGS